MSNPNRNEATTRKELIDPALKKVGWDVNNHEQVRTEIPVDGFDPNAWEKVKRILEAGGIYEGNLPKGVSDYALYRPNGDIIAIVEAKRTSIDPRLAQTQAEFYVTQLEKLQGFRPFAFMTNGNDIYFLDAGNAINDLSRVSFRPVTLRIRSSSANTNSHFPRHRSMPRLPIGCTSKKLSAVSAKPLNSRTSAKHYSSWRQAPAKRAPSCP